MYQSHPLFERLHQATGSADRRLEQRVWNYCRDFDLPQYRRLLEVCWGFYQPLERKLVVLADHLPSSFAQQRRKAPLLEQDLLALGMAESGIAALPLCGRLPAFPTLAQVLGVLYAIDGASWGERIAAAHVQAAGDKLGISSSHGGSFISSLRSPHDSLVDSDWPGVIATTTTVEGPDVEGLAIRSALDTFECFETWLAHQERSLCANSARTNPLQWSSLWEPELFCAERFGDIRVA